MRPRDLDRRTDRLARRLMGHSVPRDTFYWAQLRADIAATDLRRAVEFGFAPAMARLARVSRDARDAIEGFAETLRKTH